MAHGPLVSLPLFPFEKKNGSTPKQEGASMVSHHRLYGYDITVVNLSEENPRNVIFLQLL